MASHMPIAMTATPRAGRRNRSRRVTSICLLQRGSHPQRTLALAEWSDYGTSLRLVVMCVRYAIIRSISRSVIWSAAKPGICIVGQLRTDFGARMRARSPSRVMYCVGFIGRLRSGPFPALPTSASRTFRSFQVQAITADVISTALSAFPETLIPITEQR